MKRALFIMFSVFLSSQLIFSQVMTSDPKEMFLDAEYFMMYEEYADALPYYLQLHELNPDNANISYRIGVCYLNTSGSKEEAIPYLEKAVKNTTASYREGNFREERAPLDAYYYLGTAYRVQNDLSKAQRTYENYRSNLDPQDSINLRFIDQQIQACINARKLADQPVYLDKENLGELVNDDAANFNPMVSSDEKKLIYMTSLKFYDAIFYSKKNGEGWGNPENLTPQIKSDGDLYPTGLSASGDLLFLAKDEDFNSDIYTSTRTGDQWSPAVKMGKNVNTKFWESHASISADGKTLYFISNKPDGFGGFDIYQSYFDESINDWGAPVNLGPVINTTFNEETPFIADDGKTLYFSSQGHNNMGGYDIFSATLGEDNQFSTPVNLGYPINTTDDNLFFFPVGDGSFAYQSIFTEDGYGKEDIYRFEIYSDKNPRMVLITGEVTLKDSPGISAEVATIEMNDKSGNLLAKFTPEKSGTYSYGSKNPGDYNLVFKAEGFDTAEKSFSIPADYSMASVTVNAELNPVVKELIILRAIYFGFDKSSIEDTERIKLDNITKAMKDNPTLSIKVTGHTDSKGSSSYNQKLSQRRAQAVAKYLVQKGILAERINTSGSGEMAPVAINVTGDGTDSPKGRAMNRRVVVDILSSDNQLIKSEEIVVPAELKIK